jgi:hypothetical protein
MKPVNRVRAVLAIVVFPHPGARFGPADGRRARLSGVVEVVRGAPVPSAAIVVAGKNGREFKATALGAIVHGPTGPSRPRRSPEPRRIHAHLSGVGLEEMGKAAMARRH